MFIHKKTGLKVELVKQHSIVGRFEIINSEVKKRHMRVGKERMVCLMSEVEEIK